MCDEEDDDAMRRTEREITDRAEIEAILRREPVLHLGLVDGGKAYVVPVNFGYAENCVYVHAALDGRKIEAMKRNPEVSFSVVADAALVPGPDDLACKWTAKYRSVLGEGRATFIEDGAAKKKALDVIMSKFAPGPFTYAENALARTAVIRIEIVRMTGKKAGY
jgi:hypothetical protein